MSNIRKPNWQIGPLDGTFVGAIIDGDPIHAKRERKGDGLFDGAVPLFRAAEDGAEITDHDRRLVYEARIGQEDGRQWLTSLTIRTTDPTRRIDQQVMRSIPVQRIAEQVALHLAVQREEGMSWVAHELHESPHDLPTVEQVAAHYRDGLGRSAIAAKYQMSPYTVDDRIREGRDRGLIPPARTGRKRGPRKSRAPLSKPIDQAKRKKGIK